MNWLALGNEVKDVTLKKVYGGIKPFSLFKGDYGRKNFQAGNSS